MSVFQTFSDDAPRTSSPPDVDAGGRRPIAAMLPAWVVPDRRDWALRGLAVSIGVLALVYLSMLNPYWVPSGDGEVYTCIARSLVRGQGLMFNGARAAIAPPGWPVVLSWAMRVSPEFLWLKCVTIGCMLGAFVSVYYILRRFVSDRMAALIVVLTGTLSTVYPLTFWMHTEACFCLLGFTAILIAFRIAEGRAWPEVELPIMLLLLAGGAFVRWPGVLHLVLVVPILLSGRRRPWARPTRWMTVIAVVVVCAGTFKATYNYLALTPQEQLIAQTHGGTSENETGDQTEPNDPTLTAPLTTTQSTTTQATLPETEEGQTPDNPLTKSHGRRGPVAEIVHRVLISGTWFAWLLWQPTRFGSSVAVIDLLGGAVGWLSIGLLACTMIAALPRRNYFWVGLAAYTGGLCVLWPNPNARYFVPVAPFIILGVILGIAELAAFLASLRLRRHGRAPGFEVSLAPRSAGAPEVIPAVDPLDSRRLRLTGGWRLLAILFVATLVLNNLPLLAIDVAIFRSRDFYDRYEAGTNRELIEVAQYLAAHPPGDAQRIVVSERYDNLGRTRWSKYAMRALHLLTDQPIVGMEHAIKSSGRPGSNPHIPRWLRNRGNAQYYVFQSSWLPWRVWHFRLPDSLQASLLSSKSKRAASQPTVVESGGWELYARDGMQYSRLTVPETFTPPRRVPGL